MQNAQLIDLNNDGYYDIFAARYADGAPYILWNNQNQSFSAPDLLPLGDLSAFMTNRYGINAFTYQFADLDNNGYTDIISLQPNPKMGENIYNIYVCIIWAKKALSNKGSCSNPLLRSIISDCSIWLPEVWL